MRGRHGTSSPFGPSRNTCADAVVHPRDPALVALRHSETPVVAVERHDIAGSVVGGDRLLRVGVAVGDQPFGLEGRAPEDAVAGQALADVPVDGPAQLVARRHEPGVLALSL